MYESNVMPLGTVAAALPLVVPVGCASTSVGAPGEGMSKGTLLDAGNTAPLGSTATAVDVYVRPGSSPLKLHTRPWHFCVWQPTPGWSARHTVTL